MKRIESLLWSAAAAAVVLAVAASTVRSLVWPAVAFTACAIALRLAWHRPDRW